MKHKKLIIFLILIILTIISICLIIFSKDKNNFQDFAQRPDKTNRGQTSSISDTCEIKSALTENIELHATYYLSEVYVEQKQYLEKGANILKYTNGTYLVAPYDCYIVELNIPEIGEKCLNSNYITIESKNMLAVTLNIDESKINKIKLGNKATITATAIEKEYTGYITHIGSTANNGKFEVTAEFENDGDIKIGMTSSVKIDIDNEEVKNEK